MSERASFETKIGRIHLHGGVNIHNLHQGNFERLIRRSLDGAASMGRFGQFSARLDHDFVMAHLCMISLNHGDCFEN